MSIRVDDSTASSFAQTRPTGIHTSGTHSVIFNNSVLVLNCCAAQLLYHTHTIVSAQRQLYDNDAVVKSYKIGVSLLHNHPGFLCRSRFIPLAPWLLILPPENVVELKFVKHFFFFFLYKNLAFLHAFAFTMLRARLARYISTFSFQSFRQNSMRLLSQTNETAVSTGIQM